MDIEHLKRDAEASLSENRFRHVQGVVHTAMNLAPPHGVQAESAAIAAWLHDIAREWSAERLLQTAASIDGVPEGFIQVPALLHGPVAAHLGKTEYGVDDEEILNAVRFHTTGRPQMTTLDAVLFVADAMEPNRTYPGVDAVRSAAQTDLMDAVIAAIDETILHLIDRRRPLFPLTVLTRNDILQRFGR